MAENLLSTKGIGKEFNGVWVLNDIGFNLKPGEIHAVVGENGAGKSTFIKILSGYYTPSSGEIAMRGVPVSFGAVRESEKAGIRAVHQEINLVPHFSVYQNIFVGSEQYKNTAGVKLTDDKKMRDEAKRVLALMNIDIDVNTNAAVLNTSNKKIVEICKVLVHAPKVLVFD
jgi:ribose transport system ATP-binding protein